MVTTGLYPNRNVPQRRRTTARQTPNLFGAETDQLLTRKDIGLRDRTLWRSRRQVGRGTRTRRRRGDRDP